MNPSSRLYHVSETPGIARFDPRPTEGIADKVVWAIDHDHLPHYLLPRDCPRVAYRIAPGTSESDKATLFGDRPEQRVIAVENAWRDRVETATLHVYAFASAPFRLADANAGYHHARESVVPIDVTPVTGLPAAIRARGLRLRWEDDLWPLRDRVVASSAEFSIIRLRNAAPRRAA